MLREHVGADDEESGGELAGDALVGPVDLEPGAQPPGHGERQRRGGQPAQVLERRRRPARHHDEWCSQNVSTLTTAVPTSSIATPVASLCGPTRQGACSTFRPP